MLTTLPMRCRHRRGFGGNATNATHQDEYRAPNAKYAGVSILTRAQTLEMFLCVEHGSQHAWGHLQSTDLQNGEECHEVNPTDQKLKEKPASKVHREDSCGLM
ncbi:Aste57867_8390 [Aphanomyces stellatus]|uniref:Aste57867_8390 protein n=1 Tax=Aphanomyces stellatus TaxID=120398 RepID=A0A485KKB0_9STRA|nr:hypothetical protein As57867_008358 [Aphanomyces stellatus]VFT85276.1 Aste57867_8390 [Aphanomyces stellatus]